MTAYLRPHADDPAEIGTPPAVQVTIDGEPVTALAGQTVAAALLTQGRTSWRTTRLNARPRGVFCAIGACHDCLVIVNGTPDTRACQRTIQAGDTITTQQGAVLPHPSVRPAEDAPQPTTTNQPSDAERPTPAQGQNLLTHEPQRSTSDQPQRPVLDQPQQSTTTQALQAAQGFSPAQAQHPTTEQSQWATQRPVTSAQPHLADTESPAQNHPQRSALNEPPQAAQLPAPSDRQPKVVDVVVVGAGPAGIAAALAAADAGVDVVLIDSGRAVGGQFNRQLPVEFNARRPGKLQHGWKGFAERRDRAGAHPRITHLAESSVWAIEGLRLWVQRGPADGVGREVFAVDAKAVVLATGAYDRVLPFPGWDLPGVYSAGAAQALAKGQRISVGKRVIVAGTGPFLLPVAESLIGVGAHVVGLLEANSLKTVRQGWSTDPLVASSKLSEALGYGALLARHRIPLRHGWTVTEAHGTTHVESVTIARLDDNWHPIPDTERRLEVDAVCLGFGFTAQLELAVAAHCELTTGPDGGPAVTVDSLQQTTTPGIYAAGELTGIGGADLSTAEGHLAGIAAAHHAEAVARQPAAAAPADRTRPDDERPLTARTAADTAGSPAPTAPSTDGRPLPGEAASTTPATPPTADPGRIDPAVSGASPDGATGGSGAIEKARAAVAKGRRFANALGRAYPVREGWRSWSRAETVVCRCEEVTRGEIEAAVAERGVGDGRGLKLSSRAGLGLCQGRVCSRTVAELVAGPGGVPKPSMKRPIAVPVRLRDLAEAQEEL